jgi:hypothetical protein
VAPRIPLDVTQPLESRTGPIPRAPGIGMATRSVARARQIRAERARRRA